MITLHIGLRKTASTFLQEKVFLRESQAHYLPLTEKGSRAISVLKDGNETAIRELVKNIVNNSDYKKQNGVIISSEGLSTPTGGAQCLTDRVARCDFLDLAINHLPVIHALKTFDHEHRNLTGRGVKVILGIRKQADLLAAEYSQQSSFYFMPSQKHFTSIVKKYIKSNDEYMQFDKWFEIIGSIVKPRNTLLCDSGALDHLVIKRIMDFSGIRHQSNYPDGPCVIGVVNTKKIAENRWLIRSFEGSSHLKGLVPYHRRGRMFYYGLRAGREFDKLINYLVPRGKAIYLTDEIIKSTELKYAMSNMKLLKYREAHPKNIVLSSHWV